MDEYFEIAINKGWVDQKQDLNKTAQKTRASDYEEKIKALYNIDIKTNDSDKSVLEQAHPKPVFVSPAHDKVNGLVENLQERQDVMMHIVQKPLRGGHTSHKYARQELINELVKAAFDLKAQPELQKQADACLADVVAEIEKEANWSSAAVPAGVAAGVGAALIGGVGLISWPMLGIALGAGAAAWAIKENFYGHDSQGLDADLERCKNTLTTISPNLDEAQQINAETIIDAIDYYIGIRAQTETVMAKVPTIDTSALKTPEGAVQTAQQTKSSISKEDQRVINNYVAKTRLLISYVDQFIAQLKQSTDAETEAKSEWYKMVTDTVESLTGSDPITRGLNDLLALKVSLQKALTNASSQARSATTEGRQSIQQAQQQAASARSAMRDESDKPQANTPPPAPPTTPNPSGVDLDEGLPKTE